MFLALPHGASQELVPDLRKRVGIIVDLSADFRLQDPSLYPAWYGEEHRFPELLAKQPSAFPSCFGDELAGATAGRRRRLLSDGGGPGLGPSGPRRLITSSQRDRRRRRQRRIRRRPGAQANTHFNAVDEDFTAYGLLDHRHTPEIEQAIGAQVHLHAPSGADEPGHPGHLLRPTRRRREAAPTRSGSSPTSTPAAPFVVVDGRSPSTKATLGSNCAHLTARLDARTGWVVAIAALDNLTKGAAGQAIQCANRRSGRPETFGLPVVGVYP